MLTKVSIHSRYAGRLENIVVPHSNRHVRLESAPWTGLPIIATRCVWMLTFVSMTKGVAALLAAGECAIISYFSAFACPRQSSLSIVPAASPSRPSSAAASLADIFEISV